MAFTLPLPKRLRPWKVKIRDKERVEPPHVTLVRGIHSWRLSLRTGEYLDKEPDPKDVPLALREFIGESWAGLRAAWDELYPENPVESGEGEEDSDA